MVKLFSKNSNLCDHNPPTLQTDRQTGGQTDDMYRNTALCTEVHRAVKNAHSLLTLREQNHVYVFIRGDLWPYKILQILLRLQWGAYDAPLDPLVS